MLPKDFADAKNQWGFLRETAAAAAKAGIDPETQLPRTGLETYLAAIFPAVHDWVHDKSIPGSGLRNRPDYRSESLRLIVEFDGLQHYTSPVRIAEDEATTKRYAELGYKVVRIPYFIQLTNAAVKQMFGVSVAMPLFPENVPSLNPENQNTPAFLCPAGIARMATEFRNFPEQYRLNLKHLQALNNERLTGAELLKYNQHLL